MSKATTTYRWLAMLAQPGIGIKRWLAFGLLGVLFIAAGLAFILSVSVTGSISTVGRSLTLGGLLDQAWRGALVVTIGLLMAATAGYMLYRQLAFGARYTQGYQGIIESLVRHRMRSGGPRLVAIGGGTGLSTLLRGLKQRTQNITAIVTVTDDGGSSGRLTSELRLRSELSMIPPGDARQCLIALSESEPLMEQALSYRFSSGDGLEGHSLGNLLLAALTDLRGDFHSALEAAAELLIVRGRVMPSSLRTGMRLMARTRSGQEIVGESSIGHAGEPIESLWIDQEDCDANPAAIEAIKDADAIVIGPGSLYTSIVPNFLVRGMSEAIERTRVPKILVCNIATEHGETDDLQALDHLREFEKHAKVTVTHFLVNSQLRSIPPEFNQQPIRPIGTVEGSGVAVVQSDLGDDELRSHHHPEKLADLVFGITQKL